MRRHNPADLGTHIYTAFAGRSPSTEPTSFADAMSYFLGLAGGNVSGAARLAGVPRRTMRDWLAGKGLGPRSQARRDGVKKSAQLSARRDRLGARKEARIRDKDPGECTLKATYNYDGGDPRNVLIGHYLTHDAYDQLGDAYLDGADPDDLRELFADMITDAPFYAETMRNPQTDPHGWTVVRLTL